MRLIHGAPEWLARLEIELSDLDLLSDLDPGLLLWDPDLPPVT